MNREMTQHNELAKVLQAELDMDPIAYFSKKTESEFQNYNDDRQVPEKQKMVPLNPQVLISLAKITRVPIVPSVYDQILISGGQHKYIESLNLRETCYNTYQTLEECLNKMGDHFNS